MERTDWPDLSDQVRAAITERTGPVLAARTADDGKNSAIALLLETAQAGSVFVKGLRLDHPGVVTQHREAVINPYVRRLAPPLLWHIEIDGWNLLGFQRVPGRHADYRPGSPDVPRVVAAMERLAQLRCPELGALKRAERRWAMFLDDKNDLSLLAGSTLLHTDYNPYNVLIEGDRAYLIDWAWPTLGAAHVDPACLVVRLIAAGHTPEQAEEQVADIPAWRDASGRAIDVVVVALARMWAQIAAADPVGWKKRIAQGAADWVSYRRVSL